MTKPGTNITEKLQAQFDFIISAPHNPESVRAGEQNVALFSCFVNGEPAAAIVMIERCADGTFAIEPLFVSVTPGMVIVDHDGLEPENKK